jgi:Rrf2 family protein
MATNARFAVAVHTLGMLAFADDTPVSSERIAASVDTNAVTIRRIFQLLGQAGLVVGQMGPYGGARLARAPEAIDLAAVWRAVDDGALFALPASGGNPRCAMSCSVQPVLQEIFADAEAALTQALAAVSVADVIERVGARLGARVPGGCTGEPARAARDAGAAAAGAAASPASLPGRSGRTAQPGRPTTPRGS